MTPPPERRTHDLKCWPKFFASIQNGTKPFEVRYDDRGIEEGDVLRLREFDPDATFGMTGRTFAVEVTYRLALVDAPGLEADGIEGDEGEWVVLGIRPHPAPLPDTGDGRPDRGDEVQIAGWIGNIVRVNDREGTCDIAWWMPTGGPYGSATTVDVPLDGLHVRQQATTSRPTPAPSPSQPEPGRHYFCAVDGVLTSGCGHGVAGGCGWLGTTLTTAGAALRDRAAAPPAVPGDRPDADALAGVRAVRSWLALCFADGMRLTSVEGVLEQLDAALADAQPTHPAPDGEAGRYHCPCLVCPRCQWVDERDHLEDLHPEDGLAGPCGRCGLHEWWAVLGPIRRGQHMASAAEETAWRCHDEAVCRGYAETEDDPSPGGYGVADGTAT